MQLEDKIKLVIPDNVLHQIKYLCKEIPKVEWSGILFYQVKGDIKNPSRMTLTVKDILPMNKGSKTFTEYELDDRFMDYLMEDPERMEWKVGHIHSHNDMNTYFSATDKSELNDNSEAHNFYLSLITNNYMEMTAKVATRGKMSKKLEKVAYFAQNKDGKMYKIQTVSMNIEKEKMFVYDCEIHSRAEKVNVSTDFSSKVSGIIEDAKPKPYVAPVQKTTHKIVGPGKNGQTNIPIAGVAPTFSNKKCKLNTIEQFAYSLLNYTNPPGKKSTLEKLFTGIINSKRTVTDLYNSVLNNYPAVYERYFPHKQDTEAWVDVTQELIDLFVEHSITYPFLDGLADLLDQMKEQFLNMETHDTGHSTKK